MGARVMAAVVGGVLAGGLALPAVADAAPTNSGASVVSQQNGVTTHRLCADQDIQWVASGFAPNRRQVQVSLQLVGVGEIFRGPIALSGGSGSIDAGIATDDLVGNRYRLRFQTGSSDHPANHGSFSMTIVSC